MSPPSNFKVAIIGGGLGGLSLAIALQTRNIPFTIYESRSAFTEIGAGINVGPNGAATLQLISPSLSSKILSIATRNPPPHEETWMWFRYGAASGPHEDGEVLLEMKAPPTGNITMHRRELLAMLAGEIDAENGGNAKFGKKLSSYEQDEDGVTIFFADGTRERASVLVGCDGIHSRVRSTMFGKESIVSKPHFNQDGAYRAVIAVEKAVAAIGETGRQSQVMLGPNGYVIIYPVNGGTAMNVGAWTGKRGQKWEEEEWVKENQGEQFRADFAEWGPRVQKILKLFDSDPSFWAAHQHIHQPESFVDGRVILIGDSAHSMPPHSGAGASQAVESAYVLAEVLSAAHLENKNDTAVRFALQAVERVRLPRFSKIQRSSTISGPDWYSFYERKLESAELAQWTRGLQENFESIWRHKLESDRDAAISWMLEKLRLQGTTSTDQK